MVYLLHGVQPVIFTGHLAPVTNPLFVIKVIHYRPPGAERLFDLVRYKDKRLKGAFYYALRDTLVADDLNSASKIAFGIAISLTSSSLIVD